MSAIFYQNVIPQENQSIRCNDCIVCGHAVISDYVMADSLGLEKGLTVGTSITHDNIPVANIVQLTSISTAIDATGVANPFNFNVSTETATLSAGSHTTFFLNMPVGRLNSLGFASVSPYYYSNVVGTGGIPVLTIITQELNRVTFMLKNEHPTNALNGVIHFRFKYELGQNA